MPNPNRRVSAFGPWIFLMLRVSQELYLNPDHSGSMPNPNRLVLVCIPAFVRRIFLNITPSQTVILTFHSGFFRQEARACPGGVIWLIAIGSLHQTV